MCIAQRPLYHLSDLSMPYGPVDDKGTQLYYEESGSLEGGYLTVVLVHGTSFHGGTDLIYNLECGRA